MLYVISQRCGGVFKSSNVADIFMSEEFDGRGQRFGSDAFNRILAGRVNVGYKKRVRVVEGTGKFFHQIMCAAVAMRLKQHYDMSAARTDLRSGQRSFNLGRMVAIVINHHYATRFSFELKSSSGSGKTTQSFRDLVKRHIQFKAHS